MLVLVLLFKCTIKNCTTRKVFAPWLDEQIVSGLKLLLPCALVSYPDPSTSQLRMDYITATLELGSGKVTAKSR